MNILYKSFPKSRALHGHKFRLNKWYKEEGIKTCERGFHASDNIIDAMGHVDAEWLAVVEVKGDHQKLKNKQCWSEMRVIKWYRWTKKDSVSLTIYAAELVLPNFEKKYPKDKRPREAIEAARRVLKNDTAKNRRLARSATWSAASSADWFAASSADWSARSADWSALSAASSAASSAARYASAAALSAALSAVSFVLSAAESSAYDKVLNKCHSFVLKRAGFNN